MHEGYEKGFAFFKTPVWPWIPLFPSYFIKSLQTSPSEVSRNFVFPLEFFGSFQLPDDSWTTQEVIMLKNSQKVVGKVVLINSYKSHLMNKRVHKISIHKLWGRGEGEEKKKSAFGWQEVGGDF